MAGFTLNVSAPAFRRCCAILGVMSMLLLTHRIVNPCPPFTPSRSAWAIFPERIALPDHQRPFQMWTNWQRQRGRFKAIARERNLASWSAYTGIATRWLEPAVYELPLENLDAFIRDNFQLEELPDQARYRDNPFFRNARDPRLRGALEYLLFAKSCRKGRPGSGEVGSLLALGEVLCRDASDAWLQSRYAYQLVRLAHASGKDAQARTLYRELMPPDTSTGKVIRWWALERAAGAAYRQGDRAYAAYAFAQVFDRAPGRRRVALLSFQVDHDSTFQQALAHGQDTREKAALYAVRAMDPRAFVLEEIRHIRRLNPAHAWIPLLWAREISKVETALLDLRADPQNVPPGTHPLPADPKAYARTLIDFGEEATRSSKDPYAGFFRLGAAYCHYLLGAFTQARALLERLETDQAPGGAISGSLSQSLLLLLDIQATEDMTLADADRFYERWRALPQPDATDPASQEGNTPEPIPFSEPLRRLNGLFYTASDGIAQALCDKVYQSALQKGDTALAALCVTDRFPFESDVLEQWRTWLFGAKASSFARWQVTEAEDSTTLDLRLHAFQGVTALRKNQIFDALEHFKKYSWLSERENAFFPVVLLDPFAMQIERERGGFYGPNQDTLPQKRIIQDRFDFAVQLLARQQRLERNDTGAARAAFELGCAYLNASFYGPHWYLLGDYHSNKLYLSGALTANRQSLLKQTERPYMRCFRDMRIPRQYLQEALERTESSDSALRSDIHLQLARCAQIEVMQHPQMQCYANFYRLAWDIAHPDPYCFRREDLHLLGALDSAQLAPAQAYRRHLRQARSFYQGPVSRHPCSYVRYLAAP